MKKPVRRAFQGMILGTGAPLGWAVLSHVFGLESKADPAYVALVMGYMLVGSMSAFGVFGFILGKGEERYKRRSIVDELTQLFNARYFHDQFTQELARAKRDNTYLGLLVLDIDHFKHVNDTYGHKAGDHVLAQVAKHAQANVRETDTIARVGGEEFAVILPQTDCEGAVVLAERIRKGIAAKPVTLLNGSTIDIRVSVGAASYPAKDLERPRELYFNADKALYTAKRTGRNKTVVACTLEHEEDQDVDTAQSLTAPSENN